MACELEFFAVGEGSRAGDAIIVRTGNATEYQIMLIDGGTADTGDQLVTHLKGFYGSGVVIEHVVLTHADADHASGLRRVLAQLPVRNLWMHVPWILSDEAMLLFAKKDWTKQSLSKAIKAEYDILVEIFDLAIAQGTSIRMPFAGDSLGAFRVLGPQRSTYVHLLPQFDKTPEADQALLEVRNIWIGKATQSLFAQLFEKAAAAVSNWVEEAWHRETLRDNGVTSASNESSVILYGAIGNDRILLTGDAGTNALRWAGDYATANSLPLQAFTFVQIPHHGSRRNVGPTVLNQLLGPIQPPGTERFTALVSAPKEDNNHPRKVVLNAFTRRGGKVYATQGKNVLHNAFVARPGYVTLSPLPLSMTVEDYD